MRSLLHPKAAVLVLIALLVAGLLLRLSAFSLWGFGFDQVQILEAAESIAGGDLTLIGPRTGPASLFTGPLIYYLTAPFVLAGLGMYSLVAATLSISAVTGLALSLLFTRYYGIRAGVFVLFTWTFSLFLIRFDQVTWNPNLTLLASSLLFLPLNQFIRQGKLARLDYLLVLAGGFLGYQAHFSGLLFLVLAFFFLASPQRKQGVVLWITAQAGFALSLLPTLIFDVRNNWLNTRGLLDFATGVREGGSAQFSLAYATWKSFYTTFESIGALYLANFSLPLTVLFGAGVVIVGISIVTLSRQRGRWFSKLFPLIWIFSITCILSFYRGQKPPYYFILQFPAILVLFTTAYLQVSERFQRSTVLAALLFAVTAVAISFANLGKQGAYTIYTAVALESYLQQHEAKPPQRVSLHVPFAETFGFEYLLKNFPTSEQGSMELFISYPSQVAYADVLPGGVSIWQQPVPQSGELLFMTDDVRFLSAEGVRVYQDRYYTGSGWAGYILLVNGQQVGTMEEFRREQFVQEHPTIELSETQWNAITATRSARAYEPLEHVFVLNAPAETIPQLHDNLEIF